MRYLAVFLALAILVPAGYGLPSCSPAQIAQRPLVVGSKPPIRRPQIFLYQGRRAVQTADGKALSFTLDPDSAGYGNLGGVDRGSEGLIYTLYLRSQEGENYLLHIGLDEKDAPRLAKGRYNFTIRMTHRDLLLPPSVLLTISDESGELVYLLSADEEIPEAGLPDWLTLDSGRREAFSTTAVTESGCFIEKHHNFLDLNAAGKSFTLAPGETEVIEIPEARYLMTLLDRSESVSSLECLAEEPTHFSFTIERRQTGKSR